MAKLIHLSSCLCIQILEKVPRTIYKTTRGSNNEKMYTEAFAILREINSLQKHVDQCDLKIGEHEQRQKSFLEKINSCNNELEVALKNREKIHCSKVEEQNLYDEHQAHLEKANEHLSMATTQQQMDAGEKELARLNSELETCESNLLELMEQEESSEQLIEQKKVELAGLKESLVEIESEVKSDIEKENIEKVSLNERIEALESQLSDEVLKVYQNVRGHHSPSFTEINGGRCSECAVLIPANIQQQINSCTTLEFCGSCGRLFLVR